MAARVLLAIFFVAALLETLPDPAWAQGDGSLLTFEVTGDDVRRVSGRTRWFDCRRRPCWDFEIAVPAWIPGVTGTFADGSVEVDGDGSVGEAVGDLFEDATELQFAFVGSVGVRHRRWRFLVDGFGANLGSTLTFRLTNGVVVDGEMGALIARARLAYEFDRRSFCLFGRTACLTGAAYAGTRYYHAGFEVDLPLGIHVDRTEDWWDPIVGVDAELQWDRWGVRVNADLGGFDVSSRYSVWVAGELEYRFNSWFSILGGYALLDVDFHEGAGASRFTWNVRMHGPVLGLRFRF